ncbi:MULTISPECIES: class II aldolase/adducin family protein [unclassified Beijerinckia]|uniref:class II aldolase/adducin family protein n=1 Tax=unclassified Beijerinckia TaxID=2638183 RepID=UPI00089B1E47|nr:MULTISPECIES: class II aldolase/adducin family protein [unclassified Beijerinckia]MDH7798976.1 L-fuculose-phosphate aldolase [Beijerinckia sp. GAS462]SED85422.1 3,4-dihydroxyphthalate decarboxylase [Beijerinckia sp. 28-YEA-48]
MSRVSDTLSRLATAMRILAADGHDDIILGHMSFRDPQGRGLWLKKAMRGIDEVWDEQDFVLIDWDGHVLDNIGPCHSEWPIHTEIMKARPDIHFVGHTHARHAVIFSAANEDLKALNHEGANLVGQVARFDKTAGLINTVALGTELAECLADRPVVLMKNHGITFVGETIEETTLNGLFLERACRMQVMMASTGWNWTAPDGTGHDRKMATSVEAARKYQAAFFGHFERRLQRSEANDASRP